MDAFRGFQATGAVIGDHQQGFVAVWISKNGGDHEDRLVDAMQPNGDQRRLILLVSDADGWRIDLPDLRSRLGGSLQLAIGPPDDVMAGELILAHAEQRGLQLAPAAADYLVPRVTRSHAAIEKVVVEIDRISLERKLPATMSVWRDALEAVQGPEQGRLL